jgi:O-acetyl-ADP-ribose deacetylase (regulator of RNase III)
MNAPLPKAASANEPSSGDIETIIAEATTVLGGVVDIRRADILTFSGDAIVVPVIHDGGDGVDINEAIQDAAGPESWSAICKEFCHGRKKVGDARMTKSHNITPCRFIVHAVGPDCRLSDDVEEMASLLKQCISKSLTLAEAAGAESIAISPISTGPYGLPPTEAARLTLEVVRAFLELESRPQPVCIWKGQRS